ncbi:TRAP transporter permease [Bordetella sp. 2513F-2]
MSQEQSLPLPDAPQGSARQSPAFGICCAAYALFHLYTAFAGAFDPLIQRGLFIGAGMALAYWGLAAKARADGAGAGKTGLLALLALLSWYAGLHVMLNNARFMDVMSDLQVADLAVGAGAIVLVLVATQRLLGWALPCLAGLGMLYYLYGYGAISGLWQPPRVSMDTAMSTLYASTGGIFGFMADIGTSVIAVYVIYGALLMATGAGEVFVQVASRLAGRGHGGSAKVSVVTSALFGTVSGSAVANVMAVGSVTIPTMRRAGYPKAFAAGVEASASAGGQLMPPIMGAGAFLMAELLNIPYVQIAQAALLPALLYFALIFTGVDLYARKHRLAATPIPRTPIHFDKAVPLAASVGMLIYLLASGYTATYAGAMATLVLVVVAGVWRLAAAMHGDVSAAAVAYAQTLGRGLAEGGKGLIMIAVLMACAGLVTSILGASGLSNKVSGELIALAGDQLIVALVAAAVLCILLGMDVPTTASYVLTASVAAPVLTKLGIPPLTAHLFIFYFAILSAITPPVCASVYAAAALVGESFWRVARYALLIAGGVYFLPFMMVYRPGLLLDGTAMEVAYALGITAVAMFCIACASIGYLARPLGTASRLYLLANGILFFLPYAATDAAACAMFAACIAVQVARARREAGGMQRHAI